MRFSWLHGIKVATSYIFNVCTSEQTVVRAETQVRCGLKVQDSRSLLTACFLSLVKAGNFLGHKGAQFYYE